MYECEDLKTIDEILPLSPVTEKPTVQPTKSHDDLTKRPVTEIAETETPQPEPSTEIVTEIVTEPSTFTTPGRLSTPGKKQIYLIRT